jgi:hypothetical protein
MERLGQKWNNDFNYFTEDVTQESLGSSAVTITPVAAE